MDNPLPGESGSKGDFGLVLIKGVFSVLIPGILPFLPSLPIYPLPVLTHCGLIGPGVSKKLLNEVLQSLVKKNLFSFEKPV